MEPILLVMSNLPDRDSALQLAHSLVTARLAACVNVLAQVTSVYRWKGEIETATEVPVLIKTRESLFPRVEEAIRRMHPYELPEVVAVPITAGSSAYLEWVALETPTSAKPLV
jgi:periplasmic divalent cation tolerance protein